MAPEPLPVPTPFRSRGPDSGQLLDRGRELSLLRDALRAASAGRGALVLISGEAGIGKTALAETILAEASGQMVHVGVGRCFDLAETPPYAPWRAILADLPFGDDSPPLPDAIRSSGLPGAVSGSQEFVFDRVGSLLTRLAARGPVVILLDDLHWADRASLDLLRFLARDLHARPMLLLGAYRPEATRDQPAFDTLLPALGREAHPIRLELTPIRPRSISDLVVSRYALPGDDTRRLTEYLSRRSDGNPFFLWELVRDLEELRCLQPTETGWRIVDLAAAPVPTMVKHVIRGRLARLEAAERDALAVAAVIGQEFPIQLWRQATGWPEADLWALIERAAAAQLLSPADDGATVRFWHALTREALYEAVLPPRRRAWHRQIGDILAVAADPLPDTVAHHFERGGDPRAAEWLVRAGARAQGVYAYLTAASRYEAALRIAGVSAELPPGRGWLELRIAWLRFYQEPGASARRADDVVRRAQRAGDRTLAACARFSRGHFVVTEGHFGAGLRDIRAGVDALDALPADAVPWATARTMLNLPMLEPYQPRGVLTATLAYTGRFHEACMVGERALSPSRPTSGESGDVSARDMQTYLGLGIAYAQLGAPEQSARAFAAARAALRDSGEYLLTSVIDLYELTFTTVVFRTDDVAERRRLVAAVEDAWSRAIGAIANEDFVLNAGLLLHFLEGRWQEVSALSHGGPLTPPVRFFQSAVLGELAYATGDAETAWRLVREALPAGPATEPGDAALTTLLAYQRIAARLALDANDAPGARAWLEAHDRFLAWSSAVPGRAEGLLGWAAYYRAVGDQARALAQATEACAIAEQPRQPLALIAARGHLGQLLLEAGRLPEAAEQLGAARLLADACALPYELGLSLLALAELHAARDEHDLARAVLAEARVLLTPLAARPALSRAAALDNRLLASTRRLLPDAAAATGLSAREIEVLRLVADGLTNAQVAECLSVSRRTVSTHLTHIYTKLGVTTRTGAARRAAAYGLT